MGYTTTQKISTLSKILPLQKKIKSYNSPPFSVHGEARCAVTYGYNLVPVIWHITSRSCKPILVGQTTLQLDIITFNA